MPDVHLGRRTDPDLVKDVPILICDQPTRFGFVYALVDQIQKDQPAPLICAAEWLGSLAARSYGEDRNKALAALRAVRAEQVDG